EVRLRARVPLSARAGARVRARGVRPLFGRQVSAGALPPGALRVVARRGQVRVRLRIPASARVQALPAGPSVPLQLVVPGMRPVEVPPAAVTPARLRVVFQKGVPVPARLLLPANLPGQAP